MLYLILSSYAFLLMVASGLAPSIESWLQLVSFPADFRGPFLAILAADTSLVFLVESATKRLGVNPRKGAVGTNKGKGRAKGKGSGNSKKAGKSKTKLR